MIRPLTLVSALLAAGSGLYLYQVKHQAQLLDQDIHHVREQTEATLARAGMMRAEYAVLNDPDRLEGLATQYLPNLRQTLPSQWTSLSELDKRLPPVGAPTAEPAPLEPTAHAEPPASHPQPMIASAPDRPAAVATARVAPHPVSVATRLPEPRPAEPRAGEAPRPTQLAAARQAAEPAQIQAARRAAAPAPTPLALPRARPPVPAPGPFVTQGARFYTAAARPLPQNDVYSPPPPAAAGRTIAPAPAEPPVHVVASALGMARTMSYAGTAAPPGAASLYPAGLAR